MRIRLPYKSKSDSYTESCMIDEADRWRGRNVWYPGRYVRHALKGVTTAQSSAERTEVPSLRWGRPSAEVIVVGKTNEGPNQ